MVLMALALLLLAAVVYVAIVAISARWGRQSTPGEAARTEADAAAVPLAPGEAASAAEGRTYPRKITGFDDPFLAREDLVEAFTVALRGVLADREVAAASRERCFLTIFSTAPPPDLLKTLKADFANLASPFTKDPEFQGNFNGTRYIYDGERSLFIGTMEVTGTGTDQLLIEWSASSHEYMGVHCTCVVEKNDGRWELHSLKSILAI